MSETGADPSLAGKLTPRYRAILVVAALVILVVGFSLRPRKPASKVSVPPPPHTEVRRLQTLAERQTLETMTRHFAGIAQDVAGQVVRLGPTSGIVWSADLVVTGAQPGPVGGKRTLATASGEPTAATRVVGGPGLPLAAFQVATPLEPAARGENAASLAPGQWMVLVWRGAGGHHFAPAHHLETRRARCGELEANEVAVSLELSASMVGGGLFDLDRNLIAVVLSCDDGRSVAIGLEGVDWGLAEGRSPAGRLRALYGFRAVPLEGAARAYVGTDTGALVDEVWTGSVGDLGGLLPGDVIQSVDGVPVATPEDLHPLLSPGSGGEAVLALWRARRKRELRLAALPDEAARLSPSPNDSGLGLATPEEGFPIGRVAPGSPAALVGIGEGDRLLRVDFAVPRNRAEAVRALSGPGRPVFVEVRRGARRFGRLLG